MNKLTTIALQLILLNTAITALCMDSPEKRTIISLELDQVYYAYAPSIPNIKINDRKPLSDQDHHYIGAHVSFKELNRTYIIPALFLYECKNGSQLHFHITDNRFPQKRDEWFTATCRDSNGESFHQKLEKSLNKFFESPSFLGYGKNEKLFDYKFLTNSPWGHGERGCPNKETFAKLATALNIQPDDIIHMTLE
jgi:hypothetical protein